MLSLEKYITKAVNKPFHSIRAGVARDNALMLEIKSAQIVNTVHMVCMCMGKQHGIDLVNPGLQQLLAHISAGIHQDVLAGMLYQQ